MPPSPKKGKTDKAAAKASFEAAFKPLLEIVMEDLERQYPVRLPPHAHGCPRRLALRATATMRSPAHPRPPPPRTGL